MRLLRAYFWSSDGLPSPTPDAWFLIYGGEASFDVLILPRKLIEASFDVLFLPREIFNLIQIKSN